MKHSRVFWMLIGNKTTGSSRIHGYNIHKELLAQGIQSKIIHKSPKQLTQKQKTKLLFTLKKGDLLILQKQKDLAIHTLLNLLKLKGVKIAFVDCDIPKCENSLVRYFDYIICSSLELANLYKINHPNKNVAYIPDAVEYFVSNKPKADTYNKAIYFGWLTHQRLKTITKLKALFKAHNWELLTMSNNEHADIFWKNWGDPETYKIISRYSTSIIPIDDTKGACYKSSNRVLQSLAMKNIVLCGNITSYNEVIENGKNGFICTTPEEWIRALNIINDLEKRNQIIDAGYKKAQEYTIDKIIPIWKSFLQL